MSIATNAHSLHTGCRRRSIARRTLVGIVATMTAVFVGAATAHADEPVLEVFGFQATDINPCTGDDMILDIEIAALVHRHERNFVAIERRSGTTSDGFETDDNVGVVVFNPGVAKYVWTEIWENPETGQRFRAHFVGVRSQRTGDGIVLRFDDECLTS